MAGYNPMASSRVHALILRTYDFSEADRVVVLLSREQGKLRAVAKGVRRSCSRLSASLGLLTFSELELYGQPARELKLVTQGQLRNMFPAMKGDLARLGQAARMAELADSLIPDQQPLPEIFDLLLTGLNILEAGLDPQLGGLWYEINLLDRLGYRPSLEACLACGRAATASYDPIADGMVCVRCRPGGTPRVSLGSRRLLNHLLGLSPEKLSRFYLGEVIAAEAARVLEAIFLPHLGKCLKSDTFRKAVRCLPS